MRLVPEKRLIVFCGPLFNKLVKIFVLVTTNEHYSILKIFMKAGSTLAETTQQPVLFYSFIFHLSLYFSGVILIIECNSTAKPMVPIITLAVNSVKNQDLLLLLQFRIQALAWPNVTELFP